MKSPSALLPPEPTEQQIAQAESLFQIAVQADRLAADALAQAEAAYRAIGRPLPLFDRLDRPRQ